MEGMNPNNRRQILTFAAVVIVATFLGITGAASSEQPKNPFGEKTVAEPPGQLVKNWDALREKLQQDDLIVLSCIYDSTDRCATAKQLMRVVDDARQYEGKAMIAHINRTINLMIRPSDGYWSSPLDILKSGRGDCKDYAIAKYAALLEAGVSPDQVRLIIVHKSGRREYHMVVGVLEGAQWLLLDNLTMTLAKDTDRRDYAPQFVFDRMGVRRYLFADQNNYGR
jgi:predicted transglutaminase-like cysteine proteinase